MKISNKPRSKKRSVVEIFLRRPQFDEFEVDINGLSFSDYVEVVGSVSDNFSWSSYIKKSIPCCRSSFEQLTTDNVKIW